jgi:hypothetical protein
MYSLGAPGISKISNFLWKWPTLRSSFVVRVRHFRIWMVPFVNNTADLTLRLANVVQVPVCITCSGGEVLAQ